MRLAGLVVPLLLAVPAIRAEVPAIHGVFALQGQKPMTEGNLRATPIPGQPLARKMDFWMTDPGKSEAIKTYQTEMTKKLHVVMVSSDFKTFLHEHPILGPDGHLRMTEVFPHPGTWYVYADGLPKELNHQVFRFDLQVGSPGSTQRVLPKTGMGVQVGPYEVDLSSVRLRSGMMSMLDVSILKNGQPAKDLHPYLGSPAHAVFLNASDLSYVHVHPMSMDQMSMDMTKDPPPMPENGPSPSDMMLHIALREPGTYKLWLQFRGGSQLYVAEFTIVAI